MQLCTRLLSSWLSIWSRKRTFSFWRRLMWRRWFGWLWWITAMPIEIMLPFSQGNVDRSDHWRNGTTGLCSFYTFFIAPKASAEGACILSKMGYCFRVWLITEIVVFLVTEMLWYMGHTYRSQIWVQTGHAFWRLLLWWCECWYMGHTYRSQIWVQTGHAFWRNTLMMVGVLVYGSYIQVRVRWFLFLFENHLSEVIFFLLLH